MRFSAAEALLRAGIDERSVRRALPLVDPSRVPVYQAAGWFRRLWDHHVTALALPWGIYLDPGRVTSPAAELGPLIVHELTHIHQWRRLGLVGWVREYIGGYWRNRRSGLAHYEAYRAVPLEIEARENAARLSPE